MKWLYLITTLVFFFALVLAESPDGGKSTSSDLGQSLESKTQRKRELFGNFGKYSQGYDVANIKHSYIKPFVVQYPVQSFPIGVKIPFKNPHHKRPSSHNIHDHGSSNRIPHIHVQKPVHLPKPAWPVNNCNHGQASHPIPRPLAPPSPPTTPLIPTPTGNVPIFAVPIRPALVPPVFDAQPFIPIPAPPVPLAPLPIAQPVVPLAPVASFAHLRPILPAPAPLVPAPSVIKHGLSTHSFSFATFPRHHYVNTLPHLVPAPAPLVPAPAPLLPAHAHLLPAPAHLLPAPAPLFPAPAHFAPAPAHVVPAPLAPIALHKIPIHQFPIPAHLPVGRIPIGQTQLNFGRIPLGVAPQSHLFNQIPVNFPVAHGHFPHPVQMPLGAPPLPQEAPTGQNPFFSQYPIQPQTPINEPVFPQQQFPSNHFTPETSVNPGVQEPGNDFSNTFPNVQPGGSHVWTPMSNPTPEQYPTFQYPQQEQFPTQINPEGDTSQVQPQGVGQENEQGYSYQQNGNQPFQDGQNVQQNLQQQAEQQFLQAQQYFNQQEQPSQEQNAQSVQDPSFNQQFLQEQANQQYSSPQQQQQHETDENVQQFSQQQFISGGQISSGDPQHDPQLPQALPDHHLSGRPINQAFVRINHRRRLRKRPHRNEEE